MPLPSDVETTRSVEGPFRILVVCTGNVCRSPQSAGLLRARLPRALGPGTAGEVRIESAGTYALEGAAMDASAAAEAERLGMTDVVAHRGRKLTVSLVERADLVLGLERLHRRAAVELDPTANRRAFTLTEFAAVLSGLVPGRDLTEPLPGARVPPFLAQVVAAAAAARGTVAASRTIAYDIEDPYRREPAVYRRSADAIDVTVDAIVEHLATLTTSARPRHGT